VRRNWILVVLGFALFVTAFFLPAVKDVNAGPKDTGVSGYKCASLALRIPWGKEGQGLRHSSPLQYFSILISGWINPAFLLALIFVLVKPGSGFGWVLRVMVALMFIACWVVFSQVHLRPQIGYWLWMLGILLALFSPQGGPKPVGK
jgi:hypothetical protein